MTSQLTALSCAVVILAGTAFLDPFSPAVAQELVGDYAQSGVGLGEFSGARGIDIDGAGNVFIADRFRNRIIRYSINGEFVDQSPFFFPGPPVVTFDQVTDVAIAPNERLYVANEDDNQIVVLDFGFNVLATFGSTCIGPDIPGEGCVDPDGAGPLEAGDGQFNEVTGVAYDPNGRIVTLDTGNHRVQVFDLNGNFILKFGSIGSGDGQFQTPSGVGVDRGGNIYVADSFNHRIQIFDSSGSFLRAFGTACNLVNTDGCVDPDGDGPLELGDGQFLIPHGIAVDYGGNVYVADVNDRVQVFNKDGDFATKFTLPDDTALVQSIALDAMARIHVTTGNASGTPHDVPFVVGVVNIDTDGDGLPDLWEQAGIDLDLDGEIEFDLTNLGSDYRGISIITDPNRKDVFVEIDYFDCSIAGSDCNPGDMTSHRPRDDALDIIVQAFDDADINLWIQVDEALPYQQLCSFGDGCFDNVKAASFGTAIERSGIGVLAAKRQVFRYNLWVKDLEAGSSTSGQAEGSAGVTGNDFIVSLGSWSGGVGSREDQAGTFMHELGHTLGLGHGGGDNVNCKPNYLSVMSYTFQVTGLQPNGQFDYSRSVLPTAGMLKEDELNETIGIQDGAYTTFYGPPIGGNWLSGSGSGPIDWDANGNSGDNPAMPTDINFLAIPRCGLDSDWEGESDDDPTEVLAGFIDWDIIKIGFHDSPYFEDGQHGDPELEMDFETAQFVRDQVWRAQLRRLHEYSAKFVCGVQESPDEFRLAPGHYATTLNIHNPNRRPTTFRKKLALAFPPSEQSPGEIHPIGLDTLRHDEALKVDCEDVRINVFDGELPEPYIDGFLVVQSPRSLDVTAVYTSAALVRSESIPAHSSIDVERVVGRRIEVDLKVEKSAEAFKIRITDQFSVSAVLFRIDVTNAGTVDAHDLRLRDELRLELANAVGTIIVLQDPIELPPGGQMTDLVEEPLMASFRLELGDLAPGDSMTARFWALVPIYATAGPPSAILRDTANVSSDDVELNPADNSITIGTQLLP